ncbi:hypothetical protein EMN47_17165 [Prolixibacteraceae bacterium JC049]|nr:hypothetical protein [Prolixibacteraceae bacterium JC049]
MKIQLNEKDKTLEIKDWLRVRYFFIGLLIVLNITNSALYLFYVEKTEMGYLKLIWVTIGVLSIAVFLYLVIRKSFSYKIPLDNIKGVKKKTSFGSRRYVLELNNGKERELMGLNSQQKLEEFLELINTFKPYCFPR